MEKHEFGSSPLRSQCDYGEICAGRGSHDMTVDMENDVKKYTDLQKPSRSDRKKKGLSEKDPDAKDTKRDPDLKLAKELIRISKELLED